MGALIEPGLAAAPLAGEVESGDRAVVQPFTDGLLVAVIDGLGHGAEASAAAKTTADVLVDHAAEPVITLMQRCHEALKLTRGAVISLASLSLADHTMTWIGIGNVEGLLLRASREATPARESLLLRPGTVGHRLPLLHASLLPLEPNDLLILATDGIRPGFEQGFPRDDPAQRIADRILAQHALGTDDALVWVGRYRMDAVA